MRLKKIAFTNFKSFRGAHEFSFEAPPGLHFITGINTDNPELGANGVGKSSLFDAVYYALFGKSIRGLRPGDLVAWGEKDCEVRLELEAGGKDVAIVRKRKGGSNKLEVDGVEADQDVLTRAVGLSEKLFAPALIRGQFSTMFFDLPPSEQLKMMDDILELDSWTEASDRAKEFASLRDTAMVAVREDIANTNGRIDGHKASQAAAKESSATFMAGHARRLEELNGEHQTATDRAADAAKQVSLISAEIVAEVPADADSGTILDGIKQEGDAIQNQINEVINENREIDRSQNQIKSEISQWENRKNHFTTLAQGATCPTCEQPVGAEHSGSCVKVADTGIADLNKRYESVGATIVANTARQTDLQGKLREVEQRYAEGEAKIRAAVQKNEEIARKNQEITRRKDDAVRVSQRADEDTRLSLQRIEDWKKQEDPHKQTILDAGVKIKEAEAELLAYAEALKAEEKEHAAATFWVSGFKHVRLFVIDRAMTRLELEVNSNLVQLGLTGFAITFETSKENKSGTTSKRFDVVVSRNDNPGITTPLSAWSGGEYQRMRLACELGLANIILASRSIETDFEIFDEPTAHLSQEGVNDLMVCLSNRAKELKRQVWVIDHVAHSFPFTSTTVIEKSATGSKIGDANE